MLPLRLTTVADFISAEDVVADIGSDHGLLPLLLVKRGHTYVYASENKNGPYERLKNAIKEENERVVVALKDGTEDLPERVNTLVIAGMGGSLIVDILLKYPEALKNIKKIVVAPQGNEGEVRSTLNTLNFKIVNEKVVAEAGHYYEIVVAKYGAQTLTSFETIFGPVNLVTQSDEFKAKWRRIYMINEDLLRKPNITSLKRESLINEQKIIKKALKEE